MNTVAVSIVIILSIWAQPIVASNSLGVCYMYGNRHLIPFANVTSEDQTQYLCRRKDSQILINNKYLYGTVSTSLQPSWNQTFRFEFYDEFGNSICNVSSDKPTCDNVYSGIKIKYFSNASSIYYRYSSTNDIRIELTNYTIGNNSFVYDIQIMQHPSLIGGSRSRAYTATPAAQICGIFLNKAHRKARRLNIQLSSVSVTHAKTACIKDLRVSHNRAFAKSLIIFLLRDGLYKKSLNNKEYGKQVSNLVRAIEYGAARANRIAQSEFPDSTMNLE